MTTGPKKDAVGAGGALGIVQLQALGAALGSDPMSGVAIFGSDGEVVWANPQLSKMFRGPDATPEQAIGRKLKEIYPESFANEVASVIDRCAASGKSALIRMIWRGEQIYTWAQVIQHQPEQGDVGSQVLTISRKVRGDENAKEMFPTSDFEQLDMKIIDLGPLDVLSTRELEVLALLGQGLSAASIALALHRSVKTINTHRESIGKKLKIDDRVKLAAVAQRAGLRLTDATRERA